MTTRHRPQPSWVLFSAMVTVLIGGCEARPWGHHIPTATAAPAPDTVKAKEIKPTPFNFLQAFVDKRLRRRDEYPGSVCGFIGGDVGTPAICSSDSICLWDTAHGIVGCSPTGSGTLAVHTACVDDDDDDDDNQTISNPWVFTCRGNDECYRNTYDRVNGQLFYQFGCGDTDWATTVRTQPSGVQGQSARVVLTSINMPDPTLDPSSESSTTDDETSTTSSSSSSSTSSESSSTTTSEPEATTTSDTSSSTSGSGASTTSSGSEPSDTTSSSTPVPNEGSSTNTGAIAGGVVGGVGGLALIAGLLLFMKRRKNREANRRISEVSQTSSSPHDMGDIYEPKELDATTPQIPSELPGDSTLVGSSKGQVEPVELPGSEPVQVAKPEKPEQQYQAYRPPTEKKE
ncbi:hypothetical protein ABW19_dt0206147 [Dactylella cylindrospora]|nr:hypothetical protein ABW19_dt0206147 [Dactylella cylindrospora]